ncbi:MAG: VWA domain-containing protein [Flavobacteriales bacterium]|nr:VWA domain-containing protein [Flavobacteriales bacterium]MCB9197746.1 VWA domain-containing protein [Flavobacteriales bacterium]
MKNVLLIAFLSIFSLSNLFAQDNGEKIRILFIFDASNSMNAQWQNSSKIKVARELMLQTLDSLKYLENVEVALRLYGHQTKIMPGKQDCSDTELRVPFADCKKNVPLIKDELRGLECKGTTPIALSLEQAGNMDFPDCDNCRNVIILITDGIEACDGDPCAVAKALRSKGIKLKPFVIGVGLDTSYLGQFQCVGEFLSADTEDSFKSVLGYVISQAVNNTTVQVNLNDIKGNPKETNVTLSFYNQKTGKLMENYMHTMNARQVPDTISLNPIYTYKMVVSTVPPVVLEEIKLTPGKHNIIEVDAPQGYLDLRTQGNPTQKIETKCIIRQKDQMQTIYAQYLNTKQKLIVGNYDLEILTLPRMYMEDVNIKQGLSTKIVIPQNGYLNIKKRNGPCQLFVIRDGKQEWVCDIEDSFTPQSIALLPGNYLITFRLESAISTANTIQKTFSIAPGYEEKIDL